MLNAVEGNVGAAPEDYWKVRSTKCTSMWYERSRPLVGGLAG
jgi:hypothetical protein